MDSALNFVSGSIHNSEYFGFWKETLLASAWVLQVLEDGYKIPFVSLPGAYMEDNNASVRNRLKVAADLVLELKDQGVVQFVDHQPTCVSPLGLVSKIINGDMKHRLVFDASRWINLHVAPPTVKLAFLQRALDVTEPLEFQTIFDLKSAFHHVRIYPEHCQFLGASIPINGSTQFFVFKCLPFGLNSAVHVITKLWKPLIAYFQLHGIKASIYIDDGRLLSKTAEEAETNRIWAYEVIRKAGWVLETNKSDKIEESGQVKKYLGFVIDTQQMLVSAPLDKLDQVVGHCSGVVRLLRLPARDLSSILGKIVALRPALGPFAQICCRSGYIDIERHVDAHGWSGMITLSPACLLELQYFIDNAAKFNGQAIASGFTELRIDSFLDNPQSLRTTLGGFRPDTLIASDASATKIAVTVLKGQDEPDLLSFRFSESEKQTSSGQRELLAILKALQHFRHTTQFSNHKILWLTDSSNVVAFMNKGSGKRHIQALVFEILHLCHELRIEIEPIHLFRMDPRIQLVDMLSKQPDSDNWSIDAYSFGHINSSFNFGLDLFADKGNTRTENFVSKFYEEGALGVDAFTMNWNFVETVWICPPVSELVRIARRIRTSKMIGVVVLPKWPASPFYCYFFSSDGSPLPPFKIFNVFTPYIIQNENAKTTPMFGFPKFEFLALSFNTMN